MRLLVFIIIGMQIFVSGCHSKPSTTVLDKSEANSSVSVFYFHKTIRCPTCLYIEHASFDIIRSNFSECLSKRKVQLESINMDEQGNDSLAKLFGVENSSLVIVEMKEGQPVRHKILDKIWELNSDRNKLSEYIKAELSSYL